MSLKKLLISFLFFTAYTVVLAHSVIPHHHHEEETATEQHHDNDHHDADDDNGLGKLFSHFQHIGADNHFISTHQVALVKQIDTTQLGILFSSFYNLIFSSTGEPVPILFPDHSPIYSYSDKAPFSLRGPPSITV